MISPHQSRTDEQHEFMHREIVQKNAHIIDIRSLNIYALSWVQHNLKEHSKARFRRDYGPKVDYRRFAKKPYRRLGRLGLLGLKRLLLQYIYFPCKKDGSAAAPAPVHSCWRSRA